MGTATVCRGELDARSVRSLPMARVGSVAVLLALGVFAVACGRAEPPPAEQPAAVEPAVAPSSEQVAATPLPSPSVEPPAAPSESAPPAESAAAPDPQRARKAALEQARQSGVLGALKAANTNMPLAPWDTIDRIGEDSSGGLIGAEAGEPFDPTAFGPRGSGRGGGGSSDAPGHRGVGAIGHGSDAGSGDNRAKGLSGEQ